MNTPMMAEGSNRYIPIFEGLLTLEHINKLGVAVFLFIELLRRSKGTPRVEVTYRDLKIPFPFPMAHRIRTQKATPQNLIFSKTVRTVWARSSISFWRWTTIRPGKSWSRNWPDDWGRSGVAVSNGQKTARTRTMF